MDGAGDPHAARGDAQQLVTLIELAAAVATARTAETRAARFRYRVDALRVDGTQSADPNDYPGYGTGVVGAELHAFVTAELARHLAPGAGDELVRWPLKDVILLVRAPTVEDLRRWSNVTWLVPDGLGSVRPG